MYIYIFMCIYVYMYIHVPFYKITKTPVLAVVAIDHEDHLGLLLLRRTLQKPPHLRQRVLEESGFPVQQPPQGIHVRPDVQALLVL